MRYSAFKHTTDDWYSSYRLNNYWRGIKEPLLVEVSLLSLSTGEYRVCVWGGDDFGMERDFPSDSELRARDLFLRLLGESKIEIRHLKELGFVPA